MNLRQIRFLCIEIFKTIKSLNPNFMKNFFEMKKNNRVVRERYKLNLNILRSNQVLCSTNSLKLYGPKIWNALPFNIKTAEKIKLLKLQLKNGMRHHELYNMQSIAACFCNFKNVSI